MSDFEKLINTSDLIDWIMETYPDWCVGVVRSIVDHINGMPPAQQEIVRCKECTYADSYNHCKLVEWWNVSDDFCSRGERRQDG